MVLYDEIGKLRVNTVTEDEAEELWCPLARDFDPADDGTPTATNRPLSYNRRRQESINCIGSRCMAWRWACEREDGSEVGYCGLVGKP